MRRNFFLDMLIEVSREVIYAMIFWYEVFTRGLHTAGLRAMAREARRPP